MICSDVRLTVKTDRNAEYNQLVAELAALDAEIEELNKAINDVVTNVPINWRTSGDLQRDLEERQVDHAALMSRLRPMIAARFPTLAEVTLADAAFEAGGDAS